MDHITSGGFVILLSVAEGLDRLDSAGERVAIRYNICMFSVGCRPIDDVVLVDRGRTVSSGSVGSFVCFSVESLLSYWFPRFPKWIFISQILKSDEFASCVET